VISVIVVGAIVAFFLVKRKSKKSSSDLEKLGNQSTIPLPSNEVPGMHLAYNLQTFFIIFHDEVILIPCCSVRAFSIFCSIRFSLHKLVIFSETTYSIDCYTILLFDK